MRRRERSRGASARGTRGLCLALAFLLLAFLLTGCGLPSAKTPTERVERTEAPPPASSGSSDESPATETPIPDEEPEISLDEETGILRIVGRGGYDRLNLSQADDAKKVEIEDDSFQLAITVNVVKAALQHDAYYNPSFRDVRLSHLLPNFLNCLDGSTPAVRRFMAALAPNEEMLARTEKTVRYVVDYDYGYKIGEDQIVVNLGKSISSHSFLYALSLMDVKPKEWQHLGFASLVEICVDPYAYGYWDIGKSMDGSYDETHYYKAYYRAGGSGKLTDPMERRLLEDANAWYNLVFGQDWDGGSAECGDMSQNRLFSGDMRKEGNDMSLCMATSLLSYLADKHGMKEVAAFCCNTCSFEEAFGMGFDEARAAWEQSLMERFGDGSEEPASLSARRTPRLGGELR